MSRGIVVIPKSVTPKRIEENNKLVDLDEKDLATIAGLHKTEGIVRFVKPGWPVNLLFDEANWGENLRSLL